MDVLIPITVTDAMLTSASLPETDYAAWSAATTYARGDYCISTLTHTVYRSLTSSNINHSPDIEQAAIADPLIDDPSPVNWQVISATNRWKMFDKKPSIQATASDSISVEISPLAFIDSIAGFNVTANTAVVEMAFDVSAPNVRNLLTQTEFANGVTDAPTRGGLLSATTLDGYVGALAFGYDGATSTYAYKSASMVAGATYTISVVVKMDDGLAPPLINATNPTRDFGVIVAGGLIAGSATTVVDLGDGSYRVYATIVAAATGATSLGVIKYNSYSARTFKVTAYQVEVGGLTGYQRVGLSGDVNERVYRRSENLQDETVVVDWLSYFFEEIVFESEFLFTDLPMYASAVTSVVLARAGEAVGIGQIVLGRSSPLGGTMIGGTNFSGIDFSYIDQDEFGDLTTVVRAATRASDFDVHIVNSRLLYADQLMRKLRGGIPAVWIGDENSLKAAVNYGFLKSYQAVYKSSEYSIFNIQIQGIV